MSTAARFASAELFTPAELGRTVRKALSREALEKLTRDEILDLIAYIAARGNKDDMLFHGGHDH